MISFPRPHRLAAVVATAAVIAGSLVFAASPAYAVDAVPGAQTAVPADSLFPNQGNGGYDALHYDINLTVNVEISGTTAAVSNSTVPTAVATIDAITTGAPLSSYSFDFQGSTGNLAASTFNVSSVTVNGVPATFSRIENTTTSNAVTDNHKLIVTPATPVDGAFTTVVTYGGAPVRHTDTDGSAEGWNNTTDGATFLNQPVGSMTLFPNNNTPRDKATYKFTVNAPSMLATSATAGASNPGIKSAAVASNGELTSKTVSGDGTRTTWVWEETKPMASELSMVSIGRYDVYESDITLASGRTIHEWSFIDPAISLANQATTQVARSRLKSVIDFYESKYGPYPGNSTGLVTDVVPSAINYALETQDRPFYPNSAGAFFHEMMHQWWGDSVAPYDWNDIWLNEGPATVSETQVPFESQGASTTTTPESSSYTTWNTTAATGSAGNDLWGVPVAAMTQGSQLFGTPTYTRGAMALNVLRIGIGQDKFEQLMKTWQTTYGGSTTSSARRTTQFIALAQSISGKDLTALFNTWIFTSGKPAVWPNKFTYSIATPTTAVNPGDPFNLTLGNKNTGRVTEVGAAVTVDISDIVDDAAIGTLPANVTQSGNTLTWNIPSTGLGVSNSAVIPFTINAATTGNTLSATATTGLTMLGGTCFNCSFSAKIGASEISPAPTPTISGTVAPGQTLTADPGVWADGTTLAYQWTVDNAPIGGATSSTFVPDMYSFGLAVRVQVTGTNGTSLPTVRTSAATAAVARIALTAGSTPTISGTAQIGKPLTVDPGTWPAGTFLSYTWAANGVNVSGATGPTFYPNATTQVGQTITATVTGSKTGYTTASATSAPTAGVLANNFTATPNPFIVGNGRALSLHGASTLGWEDYSTFTYQWFLNATAVAGSAGTAQSYTPPVTAIGAVLTVRTTSTKGGYPTVVLTSDPVTVLPAAQVLQPTPAITGTAKYPNTLTLVPGTWDTGTSLAYQWFADGTTIASATALTYALTSAEIGKVITATVTSTRTNYSTVTKTAAGTAAIASGDQTLQPTPTIAGTPTVWQTLTLDPGTWDSGTAQTYQWLADGVAIDGATGLGYTLQPSETGKVITASVTSTRTSYTTVTKTSAPTAAVALATLTSTPVPTISGIAQVGETLTASATDWDAGVALTYQWKADSADIFGATDTTFSPLSAQIGAVITVAVTGTKSGYTTVTQTSAATDPVLIGVFSPAPVPTITGTAKVGAELTAVPGTWDSDAELSYQWLADGENIDGATETTYTPGPARVGAKISVAVTGTAEGFSTVTKTSDETTAVVVGDQSSTPDPTITGTPKVDVLLTAIPGSWDADTTLTYQWYADGSAVSGGTSSEFTPDASLAGAVISVKVTGTKTGYASITKTSADTDEVALGDLALTSTPQITGSAPKVAVQLTAIPGDWTSGVALTYLWYADGSAISGATASTFTPGADEVDAAITVKVTGTKAGYNTITKTSAPTSAIQLGDQVLTPTPTITGTPKIGTELTAHPGAWDAGSDQSLQWYSDGTAILFATDDTFTPGSAQIGHSLTVQVTSTLEGYTAVTKESASTTEVAPYGLTKTPTPKIVGTPKVGVILTAVTEQWDAGVALAFQWKANGTDIAGATASTLIPGANEVGKTITVAITGSKADFAPVTKTSAQTKAVAAGALVSTPAPGLSFSTARVGRLFTAVPGAWDAGTTLAYQWKSNGVAISGATDVDYMTTGQANLNRILTVTVTGSKPGYTTVSRTSTGRKILVGLQVLKPRPAITGTLAIGQTLSVGPESHDAGTTVTYTWYRDGKKAGTGPTLTITSGMKGQRIWVTSNSVKPAYTKVTMTSVHTPKVPGAH